MLFYQFLVVILDLFLLITSMIIEFLMNHQLNLFDNLFHLNYIKIYDFIIICSRIFII